MNESKSAGKGAEGRRHSRRVPEGFTLTLYRKSASAAHQVRKNIGEALLDISAGGARLRVSEAVVKGTPVSLELKELSTNDIFHARGEVRWVEMRVVDGKPQHFIGVQFVEVFTPLAKREKFFYGKTTLEARPEREAGTSVTGTNVIPSTKILATPQLAQPGDRKAERFQVDDYVVTAFRAGLLSSVGLRKNLATEVVDLSRTGAQIACRELIPIGSRITFTLHLNKFADTFETEAEVVWVKEGPSPTGTVYFTGITFGEMGKEKRRLVDYMMSWFTSYQHKYRQNHPG